MPIDDTMNGIIEEEEMEDEGSDGGVEEDDGGQWYWYKFILTILIFKRNKWKRPRPKDWFLGYCLYFITQIRRIYLMILLITI